MAVYISVDTGRIKVINMPNFRPQAKHVQYLVRYPREMSDGGGVIVLSAEYHVYVNITMHE